MKRTPKWAFFIVAILIVVFSYTAVFGVYSTYGDRVDTVIRGVGDIRWGIDIQGGVDVTFGPTDENVNPTTEQLDAVKSIIEQRLVSKNITDYEAYTDAANNQVIVRFPWANSEETPEEAVAEIGQTAMLTFYYGSETDDKGKPTGKKVLDGNDVASAQAGYQQVDEQGTYEYVVSLTLKDSGKSAFSTATKTQAANKGTISIWLDDQMISNPTVNSHISDGQAVITGSQSYEEAKSLADLITISEITPGPIAVNAASFTGYTVGGFAGAVCATLGCIFPSCLIMAALAVLYTKFRQSTGFDTVMSSIRPAVCALIFSAFLTVALLTFFGISSFSEIGSTRVNAPALLLFAGSFALCLTRKVPPMVVILLSGVLGVFLL